MLPRKKKGSRSLIDERKNESEDDRRKRLRKKRRIANKPRQFVKEITDAYNFRFAGMERLEGREVYVD